jgi:hypothetical protein
MVNVCVIEQNGEIKILEHSDLNTDFVNTIGCVDCLIDGFFVFKIFSKTDSKDTQANLNDFMPIIYFGNIYLAKYNNNILVDITFDDFINIRNKFLIDIGSDTSDCEY